MAQCRRPQQQRQVLVSALGILNMKASTLKNLVTNLMAIDLGTARTAIAVRGNDAVLDEPSYIAVNELTSEVVAYGQEAYDMQGREGRHIRVIAPLSGGVVADLERATEMLSHFVKKAKARRVRALTHAVVGVRSDITDVERRALLHCAKQARVRKAYTMDIGLAAALGAGVSPTDKRASAVVDIGAGTTNIAIVANGSMIHSRSERIGGRAINDALSNHFRRSRSLRVGPDTIENLKTSFASAQSADAISKTMLIRGTELATGELSEIEITGDEVNRVVESSINRIEHFIGATLAELRPEVSADIFERGIILTGGGALLDGLDVHIRRFTDLPVVLSGNPGHATLRGLVKVCSEPELLRTAPRNKTGMVFGLGVPEV